jgi:hypothetical protein
MSSKDKLNSEEEEEPQLHHADGGFSISMKHQDQDKEMLIHQSKLQLIS